MMVMTVSTIQSLVSRKRRRKKEEEKEEEEEGETNEPINSQ
jgi:hypothetical protein